MAELKPNERDAALWLLNAIEPAGVAAPNGIPAPPAGNGRAADQADKATASWRQSEHYTASERTSFSRIFLRVIGPTKGVEAHLVIGKPPGRRRLRRTGTLVTDPPVTTDGSPLITLPH